MDILSHMSICFFLLVLLNSPTPTKADLIGDFCYKYAGANDPICKPILENDPKAWSALNLLELGGAIVDLSLTNAMSTRDLVQRLHDDGATPPPIKAALTTCDGLYGEALAHLRDVSYHFGGRRFEEAIVLFATAFDNVRRCKQALSRLNQPPEVEKQNEVVYTLCFLGERAMYDLKHE